MYSPPFSNGVTPDENSVLQYEALIRGHLNGESLIVDGRGLIDQDKGLVEGRYRLVAFPAGVDPLVLEAVALTGYPSVCRASPGTTNPFHGGDYIYKRVVNFGPSGRIAYRAACTINRQSRRRFLVSTFNVSAELRTPPLLGDTSLIETWTAAGGRRLDGNFSIEWQLKSGGLLSALATSNYQLLARNARVPNVVLSRSIHVKGTVDAAGDLVITQRSHLWQQT
jgi:hypothetical protein